MEFPVTLKSSQVILISFLGLSFSIQTSHAVPFAPPPDNPTPPYSGSAGSRSNFCSEWTSSDDGEPSQSYALVPPDQIGLTITPNPTMMVYLQEHSPQQAFFSVLNDQRQSIYQTSIDVSGEAGVVAIALPDEVVLEIDQDYQWHFALRCGDTLYPPTPISGWVRRIEADAAMLMVSEQTSSIDQAMELGQLGLWYDTLAVLHAIAPIDPSSEDSIRHWQELFQSARLPSPF